ncbi:MAG: cupin domain-containing protein [Alphaproteobacteria bacterium]|nr:cupin domain-containing protein [Alphaproteobacteria bacterium]
MSAADDAPKICRPISSDSVAWETWGEGTRFGSRFRHLTIAAVGENYHVGMQIEELAPGMQSSPAHYHMLEEEQVLILEGQVTLRLGDETHEMKTGDYVCFPAAQRAGHCFVNNGTAPCRFLIIGEKNPNEVCVYTDSNKVMVRSLGRGQIYDRAALRDYWDGEKTER